MKFSPYYPSTTLLFSLPFHFLIQHITSHPAPAPAPAPAPFPENLIIGGTTASASRFPFAVSLQKYSQAFCAGTLISSTTLVTAAHCFYSDPNTSVVSARVGSTQALSGGTLIPISSVRIHPKYSPSATGYDIAVVELSSPALGIATARLPSAGYYPSAGMTVDLAGWGASAAGGAMSSDLHYVSLPVYDRVKCRDKWQSEAATTEEQVCVGDDTAGRAPCSGDSGGPVVSSGGDLLVGVISGGVPSCSLAQVPALAASVGWHVNWILGAVGTDR